MTDIPSLIAELEAAAAGSRELDIDITKHLYPKLERRHASYYIDDLRTDIQPHTISIDSAITGENIIAMETFNGGIYRCTHLNDGKGFSGEESEYGKTYTGEHRIEAIARRIAALRALAHDP